MDFLRQVFGEMNDPIFVHLRVNHFPIILIFVGAAAAVIAAFTKKDSVWNYALVTILLAGVTSPIAWWTGRRADDMASESEVLDLEMMGAHEDSANWAFAALVAAAIAAGLAMVAPKPALRWVALGLAITAAALTAYTGAQAGHIAHGDYTMGILK